jgi:hypothetical protein
MQNQTSTEALTPQVWNEYWVCVVGRQKFQLSGEQVSLIKQMETSGQRGIVWFKKFAINTFNIECLYLDHKEPKNAIKAGVTQGNEISAEQRERNRRKIAEMKEHFRM